MIGKWTLLQMGSYKKQESQARECQNRGQEGKSLAPSSTTNRQVFSLGIIFLTCRTGVK